MDLSIDDLPDDIALLKQMLIDSNRLLHAEMAKKDRLIEQLQRQVEQLLRRQYGRQSERVDPNQLELALQEALDEGLLPRDEQPAEPPEPPGAEDENPSRRRGHGRRRLPVSLLRQRVEYDVAPEDLPCPECETPRRRISQRVSEQLEFVPASLIVREHVELIYSCKACEEHVISGKKPPQPIDKGLAGPALLAQVVTSRFADHLPFYRQQQIFSRHGVDLDRSTLCDWTRACADLLEPIVRHMAEEVVKGSKVHTDDTPVAVLDKSLGKTRRGRLWTYIGGEEHEHIVFDYTPTRGRDGPMQFLRGFEGYLQADAYAGYNRIYAEQQVQEVACWAHARRKFFEASQHLSGDPFTAMAFVSQLYDIERRAKDLRVEERQAYRCQHARPVLDAFKTWLDGRAVVVRPKSQLGAAIGYVQRQWDALVRYTEQGYLEIDNNRAERALRSVAIGRKNWMFLGNDDSGQRTAVLYSLVVSCKNLGIDPFVYLRDVLERLPTHPPEQIADLTPKAWLDAQQADASSTVAA